MCNRCVYLCCECLSDHAGAGVVAAHVAQQHVEHHSEGEDVDGGGARLLAVRLRRHEADAANALSVGGRYVCGPRDGELGHAGEQSRLPW